MSRFQDSNNLDRSRWIGHVNIPMDTEVRYRYGINTFHKDRIEYETRDRYIRLEKGNYINDVYDGEYTDTETIAISNCTEDYYLNVETHNKFTEDLTNEETHFDNAENHEFQSEGKDIIDQENDGFSYKPSNLDESKAKVKSKISKSKVLELDQEDEDEEECLYNNRYGNIL